VTAGSTAARAAVVVAPRRVELTTVQLPPLAAGRVRIEVEGCGVCGSNLPAWEGRPWFSYPLAPGAMGHEAWGRVAAYGGDAAGPPVGSRVAFLSDNAFAEVVDVDAAQLVPVPPAIPGPFPGEALGCAFNVAARSGFRAGQVVAVVGAGFLGTLVGALAAEAGAHVIALSRRASALRPARAFGAKDVVQLDGGQGHGTDEAVGAVEGLTGGGLCDVVVEAVGAQAPLDLAGRLTKVRGRLVIAGFHQDGPRTVDVQLWNWRGIDVVNAHERDDEVRLAGIRAAADAVAAGRLDPAPLYTDRVPLERLGDALDAMVERPEGFMKALVTC
jgi:threonine dehydrogenase-like Zn-dependent dehydrogenase